MRNSCSGWGTKERKAEAAFFCLRYARVQRHDYVEKIIFAMVSHDRQRSLRGTAFQSGRFNAGDQFPSKNDKLIRPCRGMSKAKKPSTLNEIQFSALALHKLDCWIFSWLRCVSSSSLAAGINWRRSNFMQFNGLENISHSKSLLTDASDFFCGPQHKIGQVLTCSRVPAGISGRRCNLEGKQKPQTFIFHRISETLPRYRPARQLALAQQFFSEQSRRGKKSLFCCWSTS